MPGYPPTLGPAWKPGQSGNPSGRPKLTPEQRERIQANADKAVAMIAARLEKGEVADEFLLSVVREGYDRLFGKAAQTVEAEITERRPIVVDPAFFEGTDAADRPATGVAEGAEQP